MKYRKLGRSPLLPSALGIGALHFGVYLDQAASTRIILRAHELGVNFIDTAPMYGNGDSEKYIRKAIEGHRHEFLISTKVGLVPKIAPDGTFGCCVAPMTPDYIRSCLEKSLIDLGTDYIDLYQVHAFDPDRPVEDTLRTLDSLVREGKVLYTGCSNYNHIELELASSAAKRNGWTEFVSFQVQYSLTERRAEQDIAPSCHNHGVGILCNRALSRGILANKYKPNQPLPEGSRASMSYRVRQWLSESTMLLVEDLNEFARKRGHTSAELAIAWLLTRPDVSIVLAGMRNLEQLEINVRGTEWSLSEEDLREIDAIIEKHNLMSQVNSMPETFFET